MSGPSEEELEERLRKALAEAMRMLGAARRVVVFTGAGVSAESGIDTFRSEGGIWQRYPPEDFATPAGLLRLMATDPARVARFLRDLLEPVAAARPNPGHVALAALEEAVRDRGADLVVVTQNVDRLHQDAGSRRVLEVHGSLFDIVDSEGRPRRRLERAELERIVSALKAAEGAFFKRSRVVAALSPLLGAPDLRQPLALGHRPNIVLFGEALPEPAWPEAQRAAERADVMLVVGTSGAVYPAASLPEIAAAAGAEVIGVGPEAGDAPGAATLWLEGPSGLILPRLVGSR
jgi:NAD-dependent deacetylase